MIFAFSNVFTVILRSWVILAFFNRSSYFPILCDFSCSRFFRDVSFSELSSFTVLCDIV